MIRAGAAPRWLATWVGAGCLGCAAAGCASLPTLAPPARRAVLAMLQREQQAIVQPAGSLAQQTLSTVAKELARVGAALLILTKIPVLGHQAGPRGLSARPPLPPAVGSAVGSSVTMRLTP